MKTLKFDPLSAKDVVAIRDLHALMDRYYQYTSGFGTTCRKADNEWRRNRQRRTEELFAKHGERLRRVHKLLIDSAMIEWHPMETAPRDRTILLWGDVDCGDRGAAATWVMASWCDEEGMFGEEGGWLVSFTDSFIASVENPQGWCSLPHGPAAAIARVQGGAK